MGIILQTCRFSVPLNVTVMFGCFFVVILQTCEFSVPLNATSWLFLWVSSYSKKIWRPFKCTKFECFFLCVSSFDKQNRHLLLIAGEWKNEINGFVACFNFCFNLCFFAVTCLFTAPQTQNKSFLCPILKFLFKFWPTIGIRGHRQWAPTGGFPLLHTRQSHLPEPQLFGILRFEVELGHIGIQVEVDIMFQYQASSQDNHLEALYLIFYYLSKNPKEHLGMVPKSL